MPIYEYWCTRCCRTFTVICKYEEKHNTKCPFEDCKGHSVCEIPTAGICGNPKKGLVDK